MKVFGKYVMIAVVIGLACVAAAGPAAAQEAPDRLVKRVIGNVLARAPRADNPRQVISIIEEQILPYVDFQRMTALAVGRYWRDATPDQQKQVVDQFRTLLIYTFVPALEHARGLKIDVMPPRYDPSAIEVQVQSQVSRPQGRALRFDYRMEKLPTGWKLYDVKVSGAWLVETYKGNFAAEIGRSGMDGLIRTLTARNRMLAGKMR